MESDDLLLEDSLDLVFDEYKRHLQFAGQPGLGDAFFRWYLQNRWNPGQIARVCLDRDTPVNEYLPADLHSFDPFDHKWVAVYIEGEADAIVNASDSDWEESRDILNRHGISVLELASSG